MSLREKLPGWSINWTIRLRDFMVGVYAVWLDFAGDHGVLSSCLHAIVGAALGCAVTLYLS